MNTNLDNRVLLTRLIEKMDTTDMKQLLAYAAGYEAGKLGQKPNLSTKTQMQYKTANHSA